MVWVYQHWKPYVKNIHSLACLLSDKLEYSRLPSVCSCYSSWRIQRPEESDEVCQKVSRHPIRGNMKKKVGLISKSYKLKRETVDDFKAACDKAGVSQSAQLSRMMEQFIRKVEKWKNRYTSHHHEISTAQKGPSAGLCFPFIYRCSPIRP